MNWKKKYSCVCSRTSSVRREGGQLTDTEGDQCLAERGEGTEEAAPTCPHRFSRQILAARLLKIYIKQTTSAKSLCLCLG